jgi:hypothetical protein
MDWLMIAELIAKYGLPFVEKLIFNIENKVPVTTAEWDLLKAKIEIPGPVLIPERPA